MKTRVIILLSLAALMCSCAFGTRNPRLEYDAVTTQKERNGMEIHVASFKDKRVTNSLGNVRNGYGIKCADVVPENSVSRWATEALIKELIRSGYTLTENENVATVINGRVLDVCCDAYFSYEGRVRVKISMAKDGKKILDKEYSSIKKYGVNLASTGSAYAKAIEVAMQDVMMQVVQDIDTLLLH